MICHGIRTSTAMKSYIFVIFQRGGGSGSPVPPSGSAHEDNFRRELLLQSPKTVGNSLKQYVSAISARGYDECVSRVSQSMLEAQLQQRKIRIISKKSYLSVNVIDMLLLKCRKRPVLGVYFYHMLRKFD